MVEFFRGWRRKIGCVMLVMALAFMGGWVRSRSFVDTLAFCRNPGGTVYAIQSSRYGICWSKEQLKFGGLMNRRLFTSSKYQYQDDVHSLDSQYEKSKWRWHWRGFDFGENEYDWEKAGRLGGTYFPRVWVVWMIPYWFVVLPLTLLSALLLLSKPRRSTPRKSRDPSANVGA